MTKRKTAPADSTSVPRKRKYAKAGANTDTLPEAASTVTTESSTTAPVETSTLSAMNTPATPATPINDEDVFELDFGAEDEETNAASVVVDDDKLEKDQTSSSNLKQEGASKLVVQKNATSKAVATSESNPAFTANIEDVNNGIQEDAEASSATVDRIESPSNGKWKTEIAQQALVSGIQAQFAYTPALMSMAGANAVGDTIDLGFTVNGLKLEVSFKIVGLEEPTQRDEQAVSKDVNRDTAPETILNSPSIETTEEPSDVSIDTEQAENALQIARPLSASKLPVDSRSNIPCRFGETCTKGAGCPFDHTVMKKKKLCTWVNTTKGCSNGANCHFSHEYAGKMCTKSTSRMTCENGATCAFMHRDDGTQTLKKGTQPPNNSMAPPLSYHDGDRTGSLALSTSASIASLLSPGLIPSSSNNNQAHDATSGSNPSHSTPMYTQTGHQNLGNVAGLKRSAEGEEIGHETSRRRTYNNHPSQQQTGYTRIGSQNARGGRGFAQTRGKQGQRGKNNGGGDNKHNLLEMTL
ncbi:hypothetical protein IAQ61_007283 [Plenodomus lingam]|uniref:uncharacterized protein n=1 Tax=Leptosphaeria maculans TaxID=5022 RepID=UPI0033180815|nr:hypothetical protein IAQ61_007283 [Plenodomus lingam]